MKRIKKILFVGSLVVCILYFMSIPVSADTNGTELQVMEPSVLEIQLGTQWSGVEFQLKTDVGLYPDTIPVGEDGVLRLEIGGSSTYTISCINSSVLIPTPLEEEGSDVLKTEEDTSFSHTEADESVDKEDPLESTDEENNGTVAGIPIVHLVLFIVGLVVSVGVLIFIRFAGQRKGAQYEYEDDDDEY